MPRQHWRLQPCAAFIREATTGVYESDMGLWSPDAGRLLRYRRELNARNVAVFMNITPEFASSFGSRDIATTVRSRAGVEPCGRHPRFRPDGRCAADRAGRARGQAWVWR